MFRSVSLLLAASCLVLGCVPTRIATDVETLDDVNRQLEDRPAKIRYTNDTYSLASEVVVAPDSVSYLPRHSNRRRSVSTSSVAEIIVTSKKPRTGTGLAIGAAPGVVIGWLGGRSLANCKAEEELGCAVGSASIFVGGAVIAIIGGAIGALVGSRKGERLVVYDGNLERYLGHGQ